MQEEDIFSLGLFWDEKKAKRFHDSFKTSSSFETWNREVACHPHWNQGFNELPFIVSPYALFVSLRILCNATEILEMNLNLISVRDPQYAYWPYCIPPSWTCSPSCISLLCFTVCSPIISVILFPNLLNTKQRFSLIPQQCWINPPRSSPPPKKNQPRISHVTKRPATDTPQRAPRQTRSPHPRHAPRLQESPPARSPLHTGSKTMLRARCQSPPSHAFSHTNNNGGHSSDVRTGPEASHRPTHLIHTTDLGRRNIFCRWRDWADPAAGNDRSKRGAWLHGPRTLCIWDQVLLRFTEDLILLTVTQEGAGCVALWAVRKPWSPGLPTSRPDTGLVSRRTE